MERDYAQRRGDILRELDGLRVAVDTERKIGHLILDRPPLNIVSFKGRAQIRAIIEAFDRALLSANISDRRVAEANLVAFAQDQEPKQARFSINKKIVRAY